ncbi:unnamed protein product [Owenia fusiformis]|uniref:Uncharacterized protein n=1 Tax=Owenia fusiformis TaxID=6347 RepID=A0A8J1TQC4_OWEFU|nr:unnamed protein product [Owenia fusiformis]
MYDTPISLQDSCVEYICDNIESVCDVQASPVESNTKLTFKDPDVYFHHNISDQLLKLLSEKGKLTDELLSLFDPHIVRLRHVCIRHGKLSSKGLRILKSHKILELEATGLKDITVNDLIGCLGEWTLSNLRNLNVANSTFVTNPKFCVIVSLSKLKSLVSLNVSSTEFNTHGLEIITEDLPNLEVLDISSTQVDDIAPLRKCKKRLKSLSIYNLRATNNKDVGSVLSELSELRFLDLSDDYSVQFVSLQPVPIPVEELLQNADCFPNMVSIDLSGKDRVTEETLREFLDTHPKIKFVGLALTDVCNIPEFTEPESEGYRKDLTITGEADQKQILESLRHYYKRAVYVQRTLYNLFRLTHTFREPKVDILELILPAMKHNPRELGVQMAATACLYNLSKGLLGAKIHPKWLAKIIHLTLDAMDNFPNHQQLQKNALLTLCSDRILQDVTTFDKYRCARLVMDSLCNFNEPSMNRMSVAICSILAAKISTGQTSQLGTMKTYMKKLLTLVKQKTDDKLVDITMKFTLSALWNLTDESPETCEMFLQEEGLELFIATLQAFKEEEGRKEVETKILGLMNNIAEVKHLRHRLMQEDLLNIIKELLQSKHIDISYFAAGIVSHLAYDIHLFSKEDETVNEMVKLLGEVVLTWEQPKTEMVAYRSFNPFYPLLQCHSCPPVQMWAAWAILHVCTNNRQRYCPMLTQGQGREILFSLFNNPETHPDVFKIILKILELLFPNESPFTSAKDISLDQTS